MNFKTQGQELPTTNYVNKYINALTIVEANVTTEATKSAIKGTPALKLNFTTDPVEGLTDESGNPTGQTAESIVYLTENTLERRKNGTNTYPGLKDTFAHVADALGVLDKFEEMSSTVTSLDEYIAGICSLFKGKARFKFGGEEVAGKDGKPNWNKAVLAKYGFVESVTVPTEASKLKISPKDLKSLPTTDETVTNSNVDATSLY
jgi:hypothetical protein